MSPDLPDGCPEPSEPEFSAAQSLAADFRNDLVLTRAADFSSSCDLEVFAKFPDPDSIPDDELNFTFNALTFVPIVFFSDSRESILRAVADSCDKAAASIRESLAREESERRRIWHSRDPMPEPQLPITDWDAAILLAFVTVVVVLCGIGFFTVISWFF